MADYREFVKRKSPQFVRDLLVRARRGITATPPIERSAMHAYDVAFDTGDRRRLTLIIPSVAPDQAFGGVVTGLDVWLAAGQNIGAELRLLLDAYGSGMDRSVLEKRATTLGLDPNRIEVLARTTAIPQITVRKNDIFMTYNAWSTLNIEPVLQQQAEHFNLQQFRPNLQIIQDYEPNFYPFSSSHLLARQGFEQSRQMRKWAIFNTGELYEFWRLQNHVAERTFVFEPQIADGLRPYLGKRIEKAKRILVYGRPTIPRNCYPAVLAGLRLWASRYPEFSDWEVTSAGTAHRAEALGLGRQLRSVGKLPIEAYASYLATTAVGLSLMSSPHPSYPPLEMAHFGVLTITNRYANKDLSTSHDNILSVSDIRPDTLADALAEACAQFASNPEAGWSAQSHRPSFTSQARYPFLDTLVQAVEDELDNVSSVESTKGELVL